MANIDRPHGFIPYGECLRVGYYAVVTAPAINICVGDMVLEDNANIVSKYLGLGIALYDAAVLPVHTGNTNLVIGAVVGCFDEKMDAIQYIPSGKVGDGTVAGYVAIADDPDQFFEAQTDAALVDGDFDLNYEVTSGTASAPDTRTGLSTQEVTPTGGGTGTNIPIRLVSQLTRDDDHNAVGCRVICQINQTAHRYGAGTTI
jgi:hypothetical protein